MSSDSTTEARWPLLRERAQFADAIPVRRGRKTARSVWLLTGLAFLCGGLVSAAVFSIGWRHQAQRDTAARSALASATAHVRALERRTTSLQASLASARRTAAQAVAAERALSRAATKVGGAADASSNDAASVSSGAGSVTASAARIASELKTLDTYLTTTPTGQLDPGYVTSQISYLSRQLARLRADAGSLGTSVASLQAALRKLDRTAQGLKAH